MRGGIRGERLDKVIVERGLAESRQQAQALILSGAVRVDDRVVTQAGTRVPEASRIEVEAPPPYVGRGGIKLAGALDGFGIQVAGLTVLDVGASTGGFTDCLLQRGARHVYALDVGRGQLHWRLRNDPRVTPLEGINVRYLGPDQVPERVDLATIDVSFISLAKVLGPVAAVVRPGGRILALVKPQFEVGRSQVGRGGVVREPALREAAVDTVRRSAEAAGLEGLGCLPSVLPGPKGNLEYFLMLRVPERD